MLPGFQEVAAEVERRGGRCPYLGQMPYIYMYWKETQLAEDAMVGA